MGRYRRIPPYTNILFASEEVNYVTLTLLNLHLAIRNIIPAKARRSRKETYEMKNKGKNHPIQGLWADMLKIAMGISISSIYRLNFSPFSMFF